jgi:hypothetical protein
LLGKRSEPVAHQLVGGHTGNPLYTEGERGMLEHRQVAKSQDFLQKTVNITPGKTLLEVSDGNGGIAQAGRQGNRMLRIGSVMDECDLHFYPFGKNDWILVPEVETEKGISPWTKSPFFASAGLKPVTCRIFF